MTSRARRGRPVRIVWEGARLVITRSFRRGGLVTACLVAMTVVLASGRDAGLALAQPAAAPTPAPGAMTIFGVTNPTASTANVLHAFSDTNGFSYSYWSQVPAQSSETVHVRDIP